MQRLCVQYLAQKKFFLVGVHKILLDSYLARILLTLSGQPTKTGAAQEQDAHVVTPPPSQIPFPTVPELSEPGLGFGYSAFDV